MNLTDIEKIDSSLSKEFVSNENLEVQGLGNIRQVRRHAILFVKDKKAFACLEKLDNELLSSCVLIAPKKLIESLSFPQGVSLYSGDKIDESFIRFSRYFYEQKYKDIDLIIDGRDEQTAEINSSARVATTAFVGSKVKIGANSIIHAGARIMAGSSIGDHCEVFPGATIYPFCHIKNRCRINSQTTIGADGFGYIFLAGKHEKIWHFGGVEIEDDVEVGANSAIDGGTFTPTRIGTGVKIDNHVQIGHNCQIGSLSIICGGVQMGGSTSLGEGCVVGGAACFGDGLTIGPGCQIAGNAGVNCDWPAKSTIAGHPARPLREWLRGLAFVRKESLK